MRTDIKIKLGQIGKILTGNTPSTSDIDNYKTKDICFVKPSDFVEDNIKTINNSEYYISEYAREKARILPIDSVMVTCIGIIGKVAINAKECAFNQQINAIIINKEIAFPKYIAYVLMAKKNILKDIANAPVVPIINKKQFSDLEIYLPSLSEQQRIANELDKVSELIDKRQTQLQKLDLLIKSKFVEMFGDPIKNYLEFPKQSLVELGELGRGVSKHRPRNAPELLGGKYPLIQTGEVAKSETYITSYNSTYSDLGFKQSKMWRAGTLCITIAANIAKTAILTFDACFPDSIVGFNANKKTNNIFIHYWFSFFQGVLEEQAPAVAQKNINLKILGQLKVIVPPIDLQKKFADFVDKVEQSKIKIKASLDKLITLKKALMQKYFG